MPIHRFPLRHGSRPVGRIIQWKNEWHIVCATSASFRKSFLRLVAWDGVIEDRLMPTGHSFRRPVVPNTSTRIGTARRSNEAWTGRPRTWGVSTRGERRQLPFVVTFRRTILNAFAYAQQHGLATRLLDWTHNPLVALYFAVRDLTDIEGAVYAYFKDVVVHPEIMPLNQLDEVALFFPRPVHQRILVQRAFFTVHPEPQIPLASGAISESMRRFTETKYNLVRIRIPAAAKPIVQRELDDFGINHVVLFPGIDGLSEFINWGTRRAVTSSNRKV